MSSSPFWNGDYEDTDDDEDDFQIEDETPSH